MGKTSGKEKENIQPGQLSIGILAHVDAGKTTLAEAILYLTGRIRRLGRVDHQDAFLDNFALERARGITIFSKQAQVTFDGRQTPSSGGKGQETQSGRTDPDDRIRAITLLDTPGHVDFSAEMERTLQVLDYAVLVISGADGVQSHVETLWRLLARYDIPAFIFVNKMDQPGTDAATLMAELTERLDERCIDFTLPHDSEQFQESLAMCDEALLDAYLLSGTISTEKIREMIAARQIFPCYFGSALKLQGVEELLEGIRTYGIVPAASEQFGARVYKISRDAQGSRLTHMKITGGKLQVRDLLTNRQGTEEDGENAEGSRIWEEKVSQIRIYAGDTYETVSEAAAGTLCAVTGLDYTYAGEGLGAESEAELPVLEPVFSYRLELPEEVDVHQAFRELKQLEEEEPQLHLTWDGQSGEIHAQLMGEVQIEVLQEMIRERFGYALRFGEGSIVYRETIASPVVGMGHFEPLRHYAEVHLLLEPLERGSGLQFASVCSLDQLAGNWQRLILTHLEEKCHRGVLTGSEITDMKITLVAGRANIRHTEGGDFRQATYRAVRQGLMRAESVLLEPVYSFRLEVPAESAGRALADITRMYGKADAPQISGDRAVIAGTAPVAEMRGYQSEVSGYTKGRGRLSCRLKGYEKCHNAQEVIEAKAYEAQADPENPCGSVFCAHGAGFVVNWDQVPAYVHIAGTDAYAREAQMRLKETWKDPEDTDAGRKAPAETLPEDRKKSGAGRREDPYAEDEELRAIFERTYGPAKRDRTLRDSSGKRDWDPDWAGYERRKGAPEKNLEECLLVDGYNIIFAWDELKEIAKDSLEAARGRLLDLMSNYQGYTQMHLIVVFDAYRVSGHSTEISRYHNIFVVYTKEAETADQYIEKTVREVNKKYHVTVATSDALEQVIILGAGASRLSARGLHEELAFMQKDLEENYINTPSKGGKTYLLDGKEEIRSQVK